MKKYSNKRVLHVGSGFLTSQNIKYLKDNGAYVILAEKSSKKIKRYQYAVDKTVKLDIDNYDKVIKYCKENNIDAVITNGSEYSYEVARILNEAIGNYCCHTAKQWQTFVDKDNFKNICINFNIDVPKKFFSGNYKDVSKEIIETINLPVIIKPVDNRGGKGISVCLKKNDLLPAIKYAGKNSFSKTIIIEEYVEGKEAVFTYMVQNGIYKLTASSDKYNYKDTKNVTVTPDLYIYPCKDHDLYVKEVNDKVIKMLKSEGLNNCTIFFQTIEKDNKFYFFESGLRYEGTKTYLITEYYTKQNSYHLYYDTVLNVETDYNINLDDPKLNGHTLAMFAVHLRPGIIKHIDGLYAIKNNKKIEQRYLFKRKYSFITNDPIGRIFSAYCMEGSDKKELVKQIRFIKDNLKIDDIFNKNMIIDSFDETILLK